MIKKKLVIFGGTGGLGNQLVKKLESDYDLNHSDPAGYYRLGNYYADNSGTAKDPKLTLVVATVTDNATFFGANF